MKNEITQVRTIFVLHFKAIAVSEGRCKTIRLPKRINNAAANVSHLLNTQ